MMLDLFICRQANSITFGALYILSFSCIGGSSDAPAASQPVSQQPVITTKALFTIFHVIIYLSLLMSQYMLVIILKTKTSPNLGVNTWLALQPVPLFRSNNK